MDNIIYEVKDTIIISQGDENIILEKGDKIKILSEEDVVYTCQKCGQSFNDYGNSTCPNCGSTLDVMAESIKEEVDIKKVIKDLQGNFASDNEAQMKGVQLLKGLATSDDPLSNEFMKALDKETTRISKEILGE